MKAAPQFKARTICALVALAFTSSACSVLPMQNNGSALSHANGNDAPCANNSRNLGVAIGVGVGLGIAVLTHSTDSGKAIGALIGAGIGGLIGHEMDVRRCELERVAKAHDLEMVVNEIAIPAEAISDSKDAANNESSKSVGLSVSITDKDGAQFLSNSDVLQSKAKAAFVDIAAQYSNKVQLAKLPDNTTPTDRNRAEEALRTKHILLVGHTDDTGSSKLNADLSERRARAVAKLFYAAGVPVENVFYQGAGDTLPIADNHDEAGRAKNRRVEIIDTADEKKFQAYLAARKPDVNFYRASKDTLIANNVAAKKIAGATQKHTVRRNKVHNAVVEKTPSTRTIVAAHSTVTGVVSEPAPIKVSAPGRNAFDFGGDVANGIPPKLNIGTIAYNHGFTFALLNPIRSAQASDEDVVASASCLVDRPRVANAVKSLRDDKAIRTSDYLPGLNDTAWVGQVNGQTVALTHVAVLRDGVTLAKNPDMLVYRDFDFAKPSQKNRKADYAGTAEVNVYRGDKAVLYRVFSAGPVRCMDVVIPNNNTATAPESWLYYQKNQQTYRAVYSAHLAR